MTSRKRQAETEKWNLRETSSPVSQGAREGTAHIVQAKGAGTEPGKENLEHVSAPLTVLWRTAVAFFTDLCQNNKTLKCGRCCAKRILTNRLLPSG